MIKVHDIEFSYGKESILKQVSFTLEPGKIYCFLGENGSGKSTMMKIMIGQLRQSKGTITHNDVNLRSLSPQKIAQIFSYVPQTDGTFFSFSVLDMVVMGRSPYLNFFQRPSDEDYEKAEESLELVNISHLKDKMYMDLSGGQKQLVLIARAITQEAGFLLLDEPTSHLDFYHQHQVLKIIKDLVVNRKLSVLVTMHDPNLTMLFADHVYMLKNGTILYSGKTKEVMNAGNLSALYGMNVSVEQLRNGENVVHGHLSFT